MTKKAKQKHQKALRWVQSSAKVVNMVNTHQKLCRRCSVQPSWDGTRTKSDCSKVHKQLGESPSDVFASGVWALLHLPFNPVRTTHASNTCTWPAARRWKTCALVLLVAGALLLHWTANVFTLMWRWVYRRSGSVVLKTPACYSGMWSHDWPELLE